MADKYIENETFSFEKLIRLYENNPEISKIVIQRTKEGKNWRRNKDIVYISTDKSDDEILSIISGATKVVFEEHEQVKENTEEKKEYIMDPDIEKFLNSCAYGPAPKREIKKADSKKKQRFTFKKVKVGIKELLDKLETLKEEDPEKFEKISSALKETIKAAIGKGNKYIAIGLVVLTAIGAAIGIGLNKDKDKEQTTNPTQIGETIPYNTEGTTQEQQNEIDTIAEVEEDFIKDYLEVYNEKYGTEYETGEMIITALRDGAIYELEDGRRVTRGSSPYVTEEVLSTIGEFDIANINSEVVQIISNGQVLGTYNMSNGEFIYSGNQLGDLTDKEFDEPTLEKLGINADKLYAAARVKLAKGVEDKKSIGMRINNYNAKDGIDR